MARTYHFAAEQMLLHAARLDRSSEALRDAANALDEQATETRDLSRSQMLNAQELRDAAVVLSGEAQ